MAFLSNLSLKYMSFWDTPTLSYNPFGNQIFNNSCDIFDLYKQYYDQYTPSDYSDYNAYSIYQNNVGLDTFERSFGSSSGKFKSEKINHSASFRLNLTNSQKNELEKFKKIYEKNRSRYEKISQRLKKETGKYIPPELIASIHYRESSCNFNTYLHNGDPLGKKTVHVPAGIYFDNFEDAAVDAIKRIGVGNIVNGDMKSYLNFAEKFNGYGYRNKGIASPYVWSGTNKYSTGMYVADHKFSASAKDKRIGVAVMMDSLQVA